MLLELYMEKSLQLEQDEYELDLLTLFILTMTLFL